MPSEQELNEQAMRERLESVRKEQEAQEARRLEQERAAEARRRAQGN